MAKAAHKLGPVKDVLVLGEPGFDLRTRDWLAGFQRSTGNFASYLATNDIGHLALSESGLDGPTRQRLYAGKLYLIKTELDSPDCTGLVIVNGGGVFPDIGEAFTNTRNYVDPLALMAMSMAAAAGKPSFVSHELPEVSGDVVEGSAAWQQALAVSALGPTTLHGGFDLNAAMAQS